MSEFSKNIWAPWRMEYIRELGRPDTGCFLCEYWISPDQDAANHVLWRTTRSLVCFNRYPYTNGHLLIAVAAHKAGLDDLDDAEKLELMQLTADAQSVLTRAVEPHGFNIGINLGRCAGAGLPDHLHLHVVPRWSGDTNFMSVCSDVRVIMQSIDTLYRQLRQLSLDLGLPKAAPVRSK